MKKICICCLILLTILLTTGCFKRDNMEDINIITTSYPIEYVVNFLYGDNSTVKSIYPRSANVSQYEITKKQIKDFSDNDLFVYNGNTDEREYATSMLNNNRDLKIIDAAYGVDAVYSEYDLWLNPSNVLMIGQNVRNELEDYISNPYLIEEINSKYQLLKVNISELETEYKKAADNSNDKRIISSDETLKFLEKYGFTVINLTENGEKKENNIELAKSLLKNKKLSYVFIHENDINLDFVNNLIKQYNAEKLTFRILETITEEDVVNGDDYLSLMYDNIELVKKETYK